MFEVFPASQVAAHVGVEIVLLLLGQLGVAIAGQINQTPSSINIEKVDQLRFARNAGRFREFLRAGEHIDQRRFADIGAAHKSKLGHPRWRASFKV